ncbi:MAG: hypothetical protein ABFD91_19090 [Anaerohalosphaeraceae bacterium]
MYADSVTFTISAEAGFDYTALLNGVAVSVGTPVTVNQPDYYELNVTKRSQSDGTEENSLIQYIVRNSQRADTEWGLPTWTPYPMIDSSSAEFTDGTLTIITPAAYPTGLEIPIIARVNNSERKRMGVNGEVIAAGFEAYPLTLFRGVGSAFLPAATESGTIFYAGITQSLSAPKQIAIESDTTWQTVSGALASSANWGENARIRITDTLTIASGATLTIGAGSVIVVAANAEIAVTGHIIVNGTNQNPVVFTAQNRTAPWGGFLFESSTSQGNFTGTIFTASGADSNWVSNNPGHGSFHKPQQCLFYLSNSAHVTLADCYMVENQGQLGHGENGYLTLQRCLVQKFITGGQYNGGSLTIQDSAVIEFPYAGASFADADNDAFYLSGGAHFLTDSLIGWTLDDGIDAGQGAEGSLTVDGCWFESSIHEALAISSGPRHTTVANTVIINCGQAMESGYDSALIDADHCLCTGNVIGARFGDNYSRTYSGFLDVKDSLLLFNHRDVWGIAYDNWQWHLSQMDIQDNYLSKLVTAYHPDNTLWNPQDNPGQITLLEPFLTSSSTVAGVGISMSKNEFDISELQTGNKIPVRLSTFSTAFISVDYTISTNEGVIDGGTLNFIPGQTIQTIYFTQSLLEDLRQVRVSLLNPVNAELTGYSYVLYQKPYILNKTLVAKGDDWHYFKGTSEPDTDWKLQTFTPGAAWLTGPSGFGYETSTGHEYDSCITTKLTDMKGKYISVYARKLFWIDDPQRVKSLTLGMLWDDGFIAYINGQRVENQYGPTNPAYDQPASTSDHETCCSCTPDQFDLSSFIDVLTPGYNVLTLQVHNTTLGSSDFLFIPELFSTESPMPGDVEPDGDIDLNDLKAFAGAWLAEAGQNRYIPACDIDSVPDGIINLLDLAVFSGNWPAGL